MYVNSKLEFTSRLYNFLVRIGNNLQSLFLLGMRLTWGHQFYVIGKAKIANLPKVIEFFNSLNIPFSSFNASLVAYLETLGGLFLMIGFASRLISLPLVFIMAAAMGTAHSHVFKDALFLLDPTSFVKEAPYPFLLTGVIVFVFGPGKFSLDGWIKRWVERQPKY